MATQVTKLELRQDGANSSTPLSSSGGEWSTSIKNPLVIRNGTTITLDQAILSQDLQSSASSIVIQVPESRTYTLTMRYYVVPIDTAGVPKTADKFGDWKNESGNPGPADPNKVYLADWQQQIDITFQQGFYTPQGLCDMLNNQTNRGPPSANTATGVEPTAWMTIIPNGTNCDGGFGYSDCTLQADMWCGSVDGLNLQWDDEKLVFYIPSQHIPIFAGKTFSPDNPEAPMAIVSQADGLFLNSFGGLAIVNYGENGDWEDSYWYTILGFNSNDMPAYPNLAPIVPRTKAVLSNSLGMVVDPYLPFTTRNSITFFPNDFECFTASQSPPAAGGGYYLIEVSLDGLPSQYRWVSSDGVESNSIIGVANRNYTSNGFVYAFDSPQGYQLVFADEQADFRASSFHIRILDPVTRQPAQAIQYNGTALFLTVTTPPLPFVVPLTFDKSKERPTQRPTSKSSLEDSTQTQKSKDISDKSVGRPTKN